MDSSRMIDGLV